MRTYLSLLLLALSLLIIPTVGAITYPSTTPSGEIGSGTFNQYFTNIFAPIGCSGGQVIRGFTSTGVLLCSTAAASSTTTLSGGLVGTLNYLAKYTPTGTGINISQIYDDGTNIGIGTVIPDTKLDVNGQISGGFGAMSTLGMLDWNDASNARSGNGYSLLFGNTTNGPLQTGGAYYHPFSFEYANKDGNGNMTQFAIPYSTTSINAGMYLRSRFSAVWSPWSKFLIENSAGNVGIGTTTPTEKLDVAGSINYTGGLSRSEGNITQYDNVLSWSSNTPNQSGALKINLPKTWSNTMLRIEIDGYDYSTAGAWKTIVSGYNFAGGSYWANTSTEIQGRVPFTQVRLAHDGINNVIILGNTGTIWQYPKIVVKSVMASYSNQSGWDTGWSAGLITDESAITGINSPSIPMYTDGSNDVGIGTVTPGAKLEINSGVAGSGGLRFTQLNSSSTPMTANGRALSLTASGDLGMVDIPLTGGDNLLENGDFEYGVNGWTAGGSPTTITGAYAGNSALQITGSAVMTSNEYIPVDPTRDTYQLEAYIRKSVAGTTPGLLYFGYAAYNANKVLISTSPCGTYCYYAAGAYTVPVDGAYHKFAATTTGEGTVSYNFPVGTRYIRVLGLINYTGTADSVTLIDHVTLKRLTTGPILVGNNYSTTNLIDQQQASRLYTTATNNLIIETPVGGNIGIGTSTPSAKLDVVGNINIGTASGAVGTIQLTRGGVSPINNRLTYGTDGTGWKFAIGKNQAGTITDQFILQDNGNIGIGTSTPGAKLEVAGQIKITGGAPGLNKILTSDATGLASWATLPAWGLTGNAGTVAGTNYIGTTDSIDVVFKRNNIEGMRLSGANGNLVTTADAFVNGVTVGRGGGNNTFNTANGAAALASNTTGINNTANGYSALFANTTGNSNTANGYNVLYSNTTGFDNTANGFLALSSNTTGYQNTANGNQALQANTTGYLNTANGVAALRYNTTGFSNTANGYFALFANTTGWLNTANGSDALRFNTTGYQNTANGVQALQSNTTGAFNTADGIQALVSSTTGNSNTALGYFAGGFITTGSSNIAIGNNAQVASDTGSNQLSIGNWIYGTAGNIGIGTSTPSAKLDVTGNTRITGDLTVQGKVITDTIVNRTVTNVSISGSLLPDAAAPLIYRDIGSTALRWNNLYLSGQITLAGGTPGVGKILTSDATGLATWQANNYIETDPIWIAQRSAYATLLSPVFTGTPTLPTGTIAVTQAAGNSTTAVATTAFVTTADALKANIASPALTGIPTAPTAAITTNTTQLATTAFVNAQIANDAPTKTGTGASGTWGINITGNSSTATTASSVPWTGITGSPAFAANATASGRIRMFEVGCESGYGTSCDANTNGRLDLADSATSIAWAGITSKPTTVAGYAITDAVDLTSSQIITGAKYFQSNKGATSYLGANTTYGLEAYSTDGGAAAMSFHRAGSGAINLGLDPDNVFRLGGWSAPSARWQVDMSGNETVAGSMTAGAGVRALGGSVFNLTNGYSFSGVGDTDGGMYSPADGTVVLATNNAERLRIDSVGNVGVGTSTGTNRLTVSGNVNLGNIGSTTTYNNGYLVFGGSGINNYGTDLGYSNARFSTRLFAPTTADITFGTIPALTLPTLQSQFTTLMTIRGDTGNVGIGTSTPVAKLAVNSLGLISFANNAAYDIGAGRIAAGQSIYSYGRICAGAASGDCTGGGGFLADSAGTVTATNYYYNSDRNLKTNIKVISSPLEKIMSLNGYTFDWKSTGKPGLGVIAQEVEKVFPELVAESKNASGSTIKSVQYGNLVAPIIEAIKELATTVKSNNADIVALRSENEILKKRLDAIDARLTR